MSFADLLKVACGDRIVGVCTSLSDPINPCPNKVESGKVKACLADRSAQVVERRPYRLFVEAAAARLITSRVVLMTRSG
jgi:hypothetical protein